MHPECPLVDKHGTVHWEHVQIWAMGVVKPLSQPFFPGTILSASHFAESSGKEAPLYTVENILVFVSHIQMAVKPFLAFYK